VLRRLFTEGHRFDFFQAVWLLEQLLDAPDDREVFAVRPRHQDGRIHLAPHASTVFPAADVRDIAHRSGASGPEVDVIVTFMGLYGINAPLPSYFVEAVTGDPDDSAALRDFLDIFNHRIYTLFYESWKKYRPMLALHRAAHSGRQRPGGARDPLHARVFRSLAGLGIHRPPSADSGAPEDTASARAAHTHPGHLHWAAFAGRLSGHVRNREGLEALLAGTLGVPARVVENVGRWATLPHRQTLGRGSARPVQLGGSGVVGARLFDVAGKFRIVLGPLGVADYEAFRPGGRRAALLRAVVDLYLQDALAYDVELRLDTSELAPVALGDDRSRLGSTARLGHAPDTIVSETVTLP
jgi:type VI secretion system protein ImpH